jgi:phospholipid/cholesterol/gamma-HCH transport system permease protein
MEPAEKKIPGAGLDIGRPDDKSLVIHLTGSWQSGNDLPDTHEVVDILESDFRINSVSFNTSGLSGWDTNLLTFLISLKSFCRKKEIAYRVENLPEGSQRLLKLALAVPERKGARKVFEKEPFLVHVGGGAVKLTESIGEVLSFIGEAFISILKFVSGRAVFRSSDLFLFFRESGSQALPIVSLISMLVGLILAFVGAIQLQTFGAQIYVADLVGIAMVRVMGAVMTGIIMAGRTGASYAAQLGTMQVNEEIDALKTLGISPMEFLVLPRMVALSLMMPLLCIYADLMGILGGLIVGVLMLDIQPIVYLNQTREAVGLNNVWIGLFYSAVFGVIVALSGCLRGMQCGRSASAVGYATTSAVVTSIVSIIVATALITIMFNVLGI